MPWQRVDAMPSFLHEALLQLFRDRPALAAEVLGDALEAMMASGTYEYQSDFVRRNVAQGRAEGKAEDVLTVLEIRGLAVSDELTSIGRLRSRPFGAARWM